jgi:phage major head subunit gpT-like protein
MGAANQLTLDAANKAYRAIFDQELSMTGEGEIVSVAAMKTRSKAKTVEYDFLHAFDEMREWVGERALANMAVESFTIPNVKYESSLKVDRVDAESDSLGLYEPVVRGMVQAYWRKRRTVIANLLLNGATTGNNSYDGVTFFNNAHPSDGEGATQDNYDTSTGLTGANFDVAVKKMELLVDHRGNPMDVRPTHLIVGPALRATARNLFGVATDFAAAGGGSNLSNGGDNPYFGAVSVIVEPKLGSSTAWYLIDASKSIKPFILQDADDLEMHTLNSIEDEFVVMNDAFFYGTRARFGAGYGLWQLAYRADT